MKRFYSFNNFTEKKDTILVGNAAEVAMCWCKLIIEENYTPWFTEPPIFKRGKNYGILLEEKGGETFLTVLSEHCLTEMFINCELNPD